MLNLALARQKANAMPLSSCRTSSDIWSTNGWPILPMGTSCRAACVRLKTIGCVVGLLKRIDAIVSTVEVGKGSIGKLLVDEEL